MNLGIGYIHYVDEAVIITPFTLKSSTLGMSFDVGYDITVNEHLVLGFQASYLNGTLTQYEYSHDNITETIKLDSENYESLRRIELSAGLRVVFCDEICCTSYVNVQIFLVLLND